MIECCVNCYWYDMREGYHYSEHTHESECVSCTAPNNSQYHTWNGDSFDTIIAHQRRVAESGCPFFVPYNMAAKEAMELYNDL